MKFQFSSLFLAASFFLAACQQDAEIQLSATVEEEEWVQLFNGEDLTGWQIKFTGHELGHNYKNTVRVEEGLLTVSYDEWDEFRGEFGHIFYHEPFSYYRLRAEYRFVGEQAPGGPQWAFRNNGLMLHSQSAESMGLKQDFPISVEVQLLGGDGVSERSTANLCTPGTHVVIDDELVTQHCIESTSQTYHGDQWVTVEALVLGSELAQHIMEGEVVLEYTAPQIGGGGFSGYEGEPLEEGRLLEEGHIAIQAETHPTQFRTIELLNLVGCMDPAAKNYKPYFRKADEAQCDY
jgi:hypothetical protein